MPTDAPHVLLVHSHDLGRYLSCYGVDVDTPNFDRMADNGALFENHFTTAPQCSPSRGSMWTGNYPHVHGLMGLAHHDWAFSAEQRPLPIRLKELGYDTHLFGLQHVTHDPELIGFEHVHTRGALSPGVEPADHEQNLAREVAPFVESFLETGDHDDPFFASVGFFETHLIQDDQGFFGFGEGYDTDDPDEVEVPAYLPDTEAIRKDVADMRGMINALDNGMGAILDALEAAGIEDETVVLFTTEHGIPFPRAKGTCYDAGIEGALLMQYPPLIDGGSVYDELLSNVDVLPTLIDLVTGDPPEGIDGNSFLPLLKDEPYYPRERLFAEITWHDSYNPIRAVRTDRYKYIRNFWYLPKVYLPNDVYRSRSGHVVREEFSFPARPYEELYDLEEDPYESTNLAAEESYEHVRAALEGELADWMHDTNDPLLDGPVEPPDYDAIVDGIL